MSPGSPGARIPTPALLIRMSTRPKVCIAESTSAWHCSGTLTSVATGSGLRPAASTSAAVSANLSTRRAPNTTSAPASANAWANATPSPDDAPVTITTLSSSRNESSTLMQRHLCCRVAGQPETMKLPVASMSAENCRADRAVRGNRLISARLARPAGDTPTPCRSGRSSSNFGAGMPDEQTPVTV